MNSRDFALRYYYYTIRSNLPCSGKVKKQILKEIQANINNYLAEFPEAEFSQIEARFGTPRSIAAAYVDDMNTQELMKSMHVRKKIIILIASFLFVAFLAWALVVGYAAIYAAKNFPGSITIITTENDSTVPSLE